MMYFRDGTKRGKEGPAPHEKGPPEKTQEKRFGGGAEQKTFSAERLRAKKTRGWGGVTRSRQRVLRGVKDKQLPRTGANELDRGGQGGFFAPKRGKKPISS